MPTFTDLDKTKRKLLRAVKKTTRSTPMLQAGDRIMVALSGGKDSYTMLDMLGEMKRILPIEFELVAVHLDQKQPGYDGRSLVAWLEQSGVSYEILGEDTYSVVTDKLEAGSTYCSLCSRLRRGILYTAAERLGCNKIALGHHRDDALETFLMNLFYAGKLQSMPAMYTTDDGRFQVIRPLIECAESDIVHYAKERAFPILPCNLCGSQEGLKRVAMTELLGKLEESNPNVRAIMMSALANVRPTHLLDDEVREAWAARPAHIRPKAEPRQTEAKNAAEPERKGGPRLRVLPS